MTYLLQVEDNPGDALLLAEAFREEAVEIRVEVAVNGRRALERLHDLVSAGAALPDLIILDLNMPVMDGCSFLQALRQQASAHRLPVVILSSSISPVDRARTLALGAVGYLVKPNDFTGYLALARHVGQWPRLGPASVIASSATVRASRPDALPTTRHSPARWDQPCVDWSARTADAIHQ